MNSASKLQKRLALPFLLIFVVALLFCALGTSAHAGDVAGVSTHLWLTVTGDYDSDATFYVSYTDALGPHTKVYTPGMEIAAWTPVTITVVDHTAEHWTLDVDVQETWLQGVGGVTEHGDVFRVTGTNSVQVFATNFGLHYVNVHVALSELDDADNGGSGSGGSGGSGGGGGSRSAGSISSTEQHRPSVVDEQAQWVQNGTDWKLTLSSGETAADRWVQKDGHWYWFKADGIMAHSDWVSYMGHWYYLNVGGDMITGWLFWNEHWYYLKPDGIMAADEMTRDGYKIGPDGTWIQ